MGRRFGAWLPMPFAIKRAMHIHRGIKVSIRHVMTDGTAKQVSPLLPDALAASVGKPFPLGAASRAVLGCPMRVDFDSDGAAERVSIIFTVVFDLAAQLLFLPPVHQYHIP